MQAMKKKYLFIVNPNAGRGKGKKFIPLLNSSINSWIKKHVRIRQISAEVWKTTAPREAVNMAREGVAAGFDTLVAVGGDGTIHEVANGILQAGGAVALGAIRVGSGNDFLRYFDFPVDFEQAMDIIAAGREQVIDIGQVENHYFVNAIGIGFDAEVGYEMSKIHWLGGTAVYFYAVLKRLLRYHTPRVSIYTDEKLFFHGEMTLLAVGNGVSTGGGFRLTPDAKINDGQFDLCLIQAIPIRKAATLLPRVLYGRHTVHPDVKMTRARLIKVIFDSESLAVHLDGEFDELDSRSFTIDLLPKQLRVIVP